MDQVKHISVTKSVKESKNFITYIRLKFRLRPRANVELLMRRNKLSELTFMKSWTSGPVKFV